MQTHKMNKIIPAIFIVCQIIFFVLLVIAFSQGNGSEGNQYLILVLLCGIYIQLLGKEYSKKS